MITAKTTFDARSIITSTGAQRLTFESESEWLEDRRKSVGASETADVIGCGFADGGPAGVWERKTHPENDSYNDSELLALGRVIEPAVRQACREIRGMDVLDPIGREMWRHPAFPNMHATLDGLVVEPDATVGVLEAKNVSWGWDDWSNGNVPMRVQVQLQHQLACTGLHHGYAAAIVGGGKLQVTRLERNDEFIEAIAELIGEFWKCVESREVPPLDDRPVTLEVLKRLHPDDNGETIMLPAVFDDTVAIWQEVKAELKELEKRERQLKAQIQSRIGDNTYGELPSGLVISWKTHDRAGYEVAPTTYRKLCTHKSHPEKRKRGK